MKFHWINNKIIVTTSKEIKENDLYLDSSVCPKLIQYPLVMWGFADKDKKMIISHSGTTSPVSSSRRISIIIG